MSKADQETKPAVAQEDGPLVKERPIKAAGATYRLNTPVGVAFVTINHDEEGNPLEVFINVGKAGSDVAAMAEALGRTISTALRFRGDLAPIERAREISHQLSGIGGRRSVGFGPNKILSLPDAVAAALSIHYGFRINGYGQQLVNGHANGHSNGEVKLNSGTPSDVAHATVVANGSQEPAPLNGGIDPIAAVATSNVAPESASLKTGDLCPSCGASAFVYEEGCAKCYACGHSEC